MEPEEQTDKFTEVTVGPTYTTECDHTWEYAESDPNSNLVSLACKKCWQGASIDPSEIELKDGTMVNKETNGEPI